jgi:hypothetical protein
MTRRPLASAVLALLAAGVLPMSKAYACSCAYPPSAYPIEGTVFSGEVVRRVEHGQRATYVVAVDRVYSGDVGATAEVRTSASGASCGLEIPSSGPAVFFADREEDGTLSASLCGGTRSGAPPASFPEGRAPLRTTASPSPVAQATPEESGDSNGVPVAFAVVAVAGVGLLRSRRRLRQ